MKIPLLSEQTDVVLTMSLAEIFILALFAIWLEQAAISKPRTDQNLQMAKLQEQVRSLSDEVKGLKEELQKKSDLIEGLRLILQVPPDADLETWVNTIKKRDKTVAEEARRGKPSCCKTNRLVHIQVIDGTITITISQTSAPALALLSENGLGRWMPEQVVSTDPDITAFLSAVDRYYQLGKDCRFDYKLSYKTEKDYYLARTKFEHYFYPNAIVRVNEPH